MLYPAKFDLEDGCYVVSFRDIPEALTQGYSLEEATEMAEDALQTAMDFYFEDNRPVPMPSEAEEGEHLVTLPLSVWSKVLLLNTMLEQHVTQTELAKRLHKPKQEVQRIVDLNHSTKIDTVIDALKALGKQPQLSIN
ncbi:type II toxin-antitoxin system HicB family antitoxin [Acinetobacter ursingii]|uniref:type II toxin-antitoxin system HicB family antitoxin n=1 Tax=Acinetobacter ursingii TaxID=108980 RepID=UPI00244C5C20|nr:type II toxin-antitoxin system HicB family antitoxin [Acinetobacter ursingii]MDH2017881.1 type II toxin-antitoxin system HicB family antitoxin [Acinetobacter ursingii]MDH2069958.1 type II toxin-antitoxin system HicB family antitoxin [Acinetobacter ursingii]